MKVLYVILILLALFIVLTLIRAIFFKAKPERERFLKKKTLIQNVLRSIYAMQ